MQREKNEFPGNATRKNPFFPWRGESLVCFPERYFHAECSNPSPHSLQNARNRPHPTTVAAPRRPRREGRKIILYIHALPPTCFVFFCGHTSYVRDSARLISSTLEYDTLFCLSFVFCRFYLTDSTLVVVAGMARPGPKVEGLLPASFPMARPKL